MNWERILEYILNDGIFILMLVVICYYIAEALWLSSKLGKNYDSAPKYMAAANKKSFTYMIISAAVFGILTYVHSRVGYITLPFVLRGLIFITYLGVSARTWPRMTFGAILYYGADNFAVYKFSILHSPFVKIWRWSDVEKVEYTSDAKGRVCLIKMKNDGKPISIKSLDRGQQEIETALQERFKNEEKI